MKINRLAVVFGSLISLHAAHSAFSNYGLVEDKNAANQALIVGVAHNLPGIGIDVDNVSEMSAHEAYKFNIKTLMNSQGTASNITDSLTQLSKAAPAKGTVFFYFSGHGGRNMIWVQDEEMKISKVRAALEKGREGLGPISRLVLMFDSCFSGSLLDKFGLTDLMNNPFFEDQESRAMADSVVAELTPPKYGPSYFDKLMVFSACTANQTSRAGSRGSMFTNAMMKAFGEAMPANETIGEFISKTIKYTKKHTPVARLVPEDLANEKMNP